MLSDRVLALLRARCDGRTEGWVFPSYGTRVLRETGNLAAVMTTMGHKDVRTARRYQHPELDIVSEALNTPRTALNTPRTTMMVQ